MLNYHITWNNFEIILFYYETIRKNSTIAEIFITGKLGQQSVMFAFIAIFRCC